MSLVRNVLREIFVEPSDDFIRFILSCGVYDGVKTQNVLDRYTPIVKRSISSYINELVNEKIQSALIKDEPQSSIVEVVDEAENTEEVTDDSSPIITTEEELEAFYIVKAILRSTIEAQRISYKDTLSYFSVIIDRKVTRWVCRIYLKDNVKYILIPSEDRTAARYDLKNIDDIYNLAPQLILRTTQFLLE